MDFDRMKRFIELVGELTMKDVASEKPALVKAIRSDFEFIRSEFVEGNRPLYTLCVDDAQGVAQEQYKTTLTDDEIASVKKGLEWGLGECWSVVMDTAVDNSLDGRRYHITNEKGEFWANSDGWGEIDGCDEYTHSEILKLNLPAGGRWVQAGVQ